MQEYLESGQRDLWEEGLSDLQTGNTINLYKDRLGVMENKLFPTLNDVGLLFYQEYLSVNFLYENNFLGQPVSSSI